MGPEELAADPVEQFSAWFAAAREAGQPEPEAMALATSGTDGRPSVRFVLLRGVDRRGFVFYTNGASRKGQEMAANPFAALAFRWLTVDRQVRVRGPVVPVGDGESDAYFATRPRGSQIGAWASDQSRPVASRADLEARVAMMEDRFDGSPVPRPPWWGGWRVEPEEVEFWQQGAYRLHDRVLYRRQADGWAATRLFP
ncbi:MAG TPA: pyridoxamine 5'-phosphate oxidase [Acidimicrobiales bacterium]|nr:pyridoxamine 5'-phosphate oxidase [Acidimicrobiales bacterium]